LLEEERWENDGRTEVKGAKVEQTLDDAEAGLFDVFLMSIAIIPEPVKGKSGLHALF
jgi:hypothetical protein